jgi:hypothetical protein
MTSVRRMAAVPDSKYPLSSELCGLSRGSSFVGLTSFDLAAGGFRGLTAERRGGCRD